MQDPAMITIYGKKQLRTARCLWALEELGLPYRLVPSDPSAGDTRTAEYLRLNPMGKVPVLVEDDFVLTESVAINAYLASKIDTPLWPKDPKTVARIHQWSSWAITEVEFHFTVMVRELRRAAGGPPDPQVISGCLSAVAETLKALESWLADGHAYVAGDAFTIGDINTAFPISGISSRIDMAPFPHIRDWLERCTSRPAWQRVQAIDEAALAA
jgi:glutathione S-transferase